MATRITVAMIQDLITAIKTTKEMPLMPITAIQTSHLQVATPPLAVTPISPTTITTRMTIMTTLILRVSGGSTPMLDTDTVTTMTITPTLIGMTTILCPMA